MPRPRVFVSRRLFDDTLALLAEHADIDVYEMKQALAKPWLEERA